MSSYLEVNGTKMPLPGLDVWVKRVNDLKEENARLREYAHQLEEQLARRDTCQ